MPAVSGFVFDSAGVPVDRELRIYRRDTGALLGNARSPGGDGDLDFDKVSLLLHCDGADDSTTFTDKSPSPKTFAAYGGAKIATAQSKFGGASLRTSSGGLYLSGGENPLHMGVSDFTVECWLRPDTSAAGAIINNYGGGNTSSGFVVQSNGSGVVAAYFYSGSTAFAATSASGKLAAGVWQHLAVVRHGASFVLYLNGLNIASASVGTSVMNAAAAPMRIGMESGTGAYPIAAYFDELRVTKGSARYTTNFTPPTEPFPDMSGADRTLAFGEYHFATTHTGEVQVVCVDDASGPLENDLILRTFPV